MTSPAYAQLMARYNRWQNDNLIAAAETLDDGARTADRGAFFGSITRTFSHLLWGDGIWLGRFIGQDLSSGGIGNSFALADDWHSFRDRRAQMDARILDWADQVKPEWFAGEMTWYSGAMGREVTLPLSVLSVQMFNHQTYHRGQIYAMLTAAGARPGDTDVFFLPDLTDPPG